MMHAVAGLFLSFPFANNVYELRTTAAKQHVPSIKHVVFRLRGGALLF